jgi:hypothetical protein
VLTDGVVVLLVEVAQVLVALVGLTTAVLEWSAVMALRQAHRTAAQRLLANQAMRIEVLRAAVHVVILLTASLSVILPSPPVDGTMPHWIGDVLIWRKVGLLLVAVIATAGTVSSRITRLRVAATFRAAQHEE